MPTFILNLINRTLWIYTYSTCLQSQANLAFIWPDDLSKWTGVPCISHQPVKLKITNMRSVCEFPVLIFPCHHYSMQIAAILHANHLWMCQEGVFGSFEWSFWNWNFRGIFIVRVLRLYSRQIYKIMMYVWLSPEQILRNYSKFVHSKI